MKRNSIAQPASFEFAGTLLLPCPRRGWVTDPAACDFGALGNPVECIFDSWARTGKQEADAIAQIQGTAKCQLHKRGSRASSPPSPASVLSMEMKGFSATRVLISTPWPTKRPLKR